jgi:hypothetical protein
MLFYYNNLDNFFQDIHHVFKKIENTRDEQRLTSIEDLSILERNISVQIDLYSYCVDYALSNFYDELYDDNIDSELTFETTDDYVNFQMGKLQKCIDTQVEKYLSYDEVTEETQPVDPLGLAALTLKETKNLHPVAPVYGGKNNRISNPKQNTKYRKKYKKFVSKYIIKKKKNNNKNNNKNNKNKTRKNKRLTKSTPNSKRNSKTLKNKKRKTKPNKHKSKQNNKKTKTNYYNSYKHNKTLKH